QVGHVGLFVRPNSAVAPRPRDDAISGAARRCEKRRHKATRIAGQECEMNAVPDRFHAVVVLLPAPVFVVPDREERLAARDRFHVVMDIDIAAIGYIIAVLLHPEGEGKFPKQEFAGALRQRVVINLHVLAVGPVEADLYAGAQDDAVRSVVGVERIAVGPLVVSLPRVVAALEQEISRAVVADDEDDVTLIAMRGPGQFPQIHAAGPIPGNRKPRARFPLAFAQPLLADGRRGLDFAFERTQLPQVPAALALV